MAGMSERDDAMKGSPHPPCRTRYMAEHRARKTGKMTAYDASSLTSMGWKGERGAVEPCGCVVYRRFKENEEGRMVLGDEIMERCKKHTNKDNLNIWEVREMATKTAAAKKETAVKGQKETAVKADKGKKATPPAKEEKKAERSKDNNVITCPECGIDNPKNRVTCEVCGAKLLHERTETGTKRGQMGPANGKRRVDVVLFELNKKLETAINKKDKGKADEMREFIKVEVAKTNGTYRVNKQGFAEQAKSTGEKKTTPKKLKMQRYCPCCGEATKNGSFFIPGHDARVKGMLKRMEEGTQKEKVSKAVQELFELKKKNPDATVKELAGMLKQNQAN
jgi:hypothetical protein